MSTVQVEVALDDDDGLQHRHQSLAGTFVTHTSCTVSTSLSTLLLIL